MTLGSEGEGGRERCEGEERGGGGEMMSGSSYQHWPEGRQTMDRILSLHNITSPPSEIDTKYNINGTMYRPTYILYSS